MIQLDFLCFRIRGRESRMHNATIILGLLFCMMAGLVTVTSETFPSKKQKALRIIRLTGRASRRAKREIQELWTY